MILLGLSLALLIGLSLGLLGAGGSILTVPIFVYVLGFGAKEAIASSLLVVAMTSLVGTVEHRRQGHVAMRAALVFGAFAMVGAYLGSRLAVFVGGDVQLVLFAFVMLTAAFFVLREGGVGESSGLSGGGIGRMAARLAGPALGVGMLTGLVGVGGGFLIVPALVLLAGMPMKVAVGTSLPIIALNSAAGFLGYLGIVQTRWWVVAAFVAFAVAGGFAGTHAGRSFSAEALRRAFGVLLVLMALFILYQNRGVLPSL